MKIHYWKLKPSYIQAIYSDFHRVFKKTSLYKTCEKYPEATLYGVVSILGVVFLLTARVFASAPQITESGIQVPQIQEIKPLKAPKRQKVQLAEIKVTKPSQPLIGAVSGDVWYKLRLCESGNDYRKNSGNGFYGAYQFDYGTWQGRGTAYERADLAPPAVQDQEAKELQAERGWGPWPSCSAQLGLR